MERDQRLEVRLAGQDIARLDQIRGERSRSDMVRHLIATSADTSSVTDEAVVEVVEVVEVVTGVSATPAPTLAQTVPAAARVPVVEKTTEVVAEVVAEQVPEHRHRRGAVIDTRWVKGTAVKTYACSTDGCPAVLS